MVNTCVFDDNIMEVVTDFREELIQEFVFLRAVFELRRDLTIDGVQPFLRDWNDRAAFYALPQEYAVHLHTWK